MGIRIERRVRFGDTDPYGALFFSALMNYFKEGVDEFIRHRGVSPTEVFRNKKEGFGLPIVHAEATYRRPVFYDDTIIVECNVTGTSEKSITFSCSAESGGEVVGEGKLVFASISSNWKPIPLPEKIREISRAKRIKN